MPPVRAASIPSQQLVGGYADLVAFLELDLRMKASQSLFAQIWVSKSRLLFTKMLILGRTKPAKDK